MTNIFPLPVSAKLVCSACGAPGEGTCRCNATYVPVSQHAAVVVAANPEKSARMIAEETGIPRRTLDRAREAAGDAVDKTDEKSGGPNGPPEHRVTGRDHKSYPAKARKQPKTPEARREKIGMPIKEKFADGKWHKVETIANQLGYDPDHVEDTIKGMAKNKTYGTSVERKTVGIHTEYRIFPTDKTVSVKELIEKLTPIIEKLREQGRQTIATMSPPSVAMLAGQIQKLLDKWAE